MALFNNITRGGQVHIHQIRMIRQVIWGAILVSVCLGGGTFGFKVYRFIPSWAWQVIWEYHVAELNLATQPYEKKSLVTQKYYPPKGNPYRRTSLSILNDPFIKRTTFVVERYVTACFWRSLKIGGWGFFLTLVGWYLMGKKHRRKQKHRGNVLVSPRALAWRLRGTFRASDLKLGKLPLVRNSETRHILVSGAIGAGKTNTFHTLLPRIRERGNKAIIIDVEGDMVSRYYREDKDILLNPFDARSVYWDLWQELDSEPVYKVFASAVVPPIQNVKDPLWENAARRVLTAALMKFKERGETCPRKFYEVMVYSDVREYEEFFRRTEAATFTQEKGDKFTISVRASLEQYLEFFKYLSQPKGRNTFCLRQWIQSDVKDQWLFISTKEDYRLSMVPLISGWTDIAMSALMSLPKDRRRRLWIVLDELPALNALPCMMSTMSRSRKYGGCILAGVQNFKQLEITYGRTEAEVLIDLFNTKVFFRHSEQGTAEWVARALGEREETEVMESLSYGANTMRDGVSLNQQTKRIPLVIPTEVTTLKDFEAFVKLPGHYPVTRLKIPLVRGEEITQEFVPCDLEKIKQPASAESSLQQGSSESAKEGGDKEDVEEAVKEEQELFSAISEIEMFEHSPLALAQVHPQAPTSTHAHLQDQDYTFSRKKQGANERKQSVSFDALPMTLERIEKSLDLVDVTIKIKYMAVLSLLLKEAHRGRIYTSSSFSARFEGLGGFGSVSSITSTIHALSSKNVIKYFMNGQDYGFEFCKTGYLWAPGMSILRPGVQDENGLEVYVEPIPTHAKHPSSGILKEIAV